MVSIWPIDGTLIDITILGRTEPGSNGNDRVLHNPQNSRTGASSSDGIVSYPRHLLR